MTGLPDRIGRYEVINLLGQGGMGVLYLARDPVIDRHVALKLLKVDNEDLRRRFVREARSAGRLQHPNIVTVYDVGDHEGELFIAMEYIDGDTLATLIRDDVPFSTVRKLELLDQLADGLGFAHHRSIIHRDIKPANLMVTRGGLLKVLDFGIARISRRQAAAASLPSGTLIGTPAYMAPEQLEGGEVDHRADIFAVGLVMYELLSGRRAFGGATTADVLQNVLRSEPAPLDTLVPGIDPDLTRVVQRALVKRPEERYQDLQDLRNDLGRVRRRAELESGSFDATIVVQLPPTRPVTPPPLPPPTPHVAHDTRPATTGGHDVPVVDADDEGDVLRHFASGAGRTTRPVDVPANVDDTHYVVPSAPVPAVPVPVVPVHATAPAAESAAGQAAAGPDMPTIVAPVAMPSDPVAAAPVPLMSPPPTPGTAPTPAPVRRSVMPALIVLGVVVLMLAAATLGALWWLRAQFYERFTPAATTEARVDQPADAADNAVTTSSATIEAPKGSPETGQAEADPASASTTTTATEPLPSATTPPPAVTSTQAPTDAATSVPAVPRPAAPRPTPEPPATTRSSQPRGETAAPTPAAPSPVRPPAPGVAPADEPPALPARDAPAPVMVARDDALALVRAYVAARNTAHAAGLRRVWPSVTDAEVRRMTGEFSAPLTLTGCDVDATGGARMRATCQFTQPGTTGFSAGTTLNIRRQLAFDMERQGRGWVIVAVGG
jgi:serine/threonine-protein kinase